MPKLAIVFGILIALISPVSMGVAGHFAKTALIPAGFGIALILCGLLAMNPKMRMHAMHAAALVGLVGALAGFGRSLPKLLGSESIALPVAAYSTLVFAILSAVFVALTVKSFIAARRARKLAA